MKTTVHLEIITHERQIPQRILDHYQVEATVLAETKFYTIWGLETNEDGDTDSGFELWDEPDVKDHIVAYSWSRPIPIQGYSGAQLLERLKSIKQPIIPIVIMDEKEEN